MGLAKDRPEWSRFGRRRAMDKAFRAGKPERILYESDFDRGFDNWIDMWDGYRPLPPISLTNHAAQAGSRSLMLSTTEGPFVAGQWGNGNNTFRRMTRTRPDTPDYPGQDRFASISAYIAIGSGGFTQSWGEIALYLDTNAYDNSQRQFYRVLCQSTGAPSFSRWQIARDSNYLNNIAVPGATHKLAGDNDNKFNFSYVRFTIDRAANGGLGGYHELQVGPHVFDLAALGAGSPAEPLQSAGEAIQEFNGGDNIGVGISRATGIAGGCQLLVNSVTYSVRDAA